MSAPEVLYGGSIGVNPRVADIDINQAATDFLWAVFAIMLFSDLAFMFFSFRVSTACASWYDYPCSCSSQRPLGTRLFHQLPVIILTTAAIAYFSMASDLGATAVVAEYPRGAAYGVTRSIWVCFRCIT
jgi:bacteriorhodopsin